MQQLFKTVYSRIMFKPDLNFEFISDGVKYTYRERLFIAKRKNNVIFSLFVDRKMIQDYYRAMMHRYCPCERFRILYRINPHLRTFMRIEPNFLEFIMPYFFLYQQKIYFKYWLYYYNLTNSVLPYDNYYLKFLIDNLL